MIRVTSEAICETAESMMKQKKFNIEMYLKFNVGPLHLLDKFIKESLTLTLPDLIWEKNNTRSADLLPMTWTRVRLWKPLKKGLKTSLVFQHCFGKILLDKIYKCVLFENFNKLFCYWKIKDNFFLSGWVLHLIWQHLLSFRFSTLYSPLTTGR